MHALIFLRKFDFLMFPKRVAFVSVIVVAIVTGGGPNGFNDSENYDFLPLRRRIHAYMSSPLWRRSSGESDADFVKALNVLRNLPQSHPLVDLTMEAIARVSRELDRVDRMQTVISANTLSLVLFASETVRLTAALRLIGNESLETAQKLLSVNSVDDPQRKRTEYALIDSAKSICRIELSKTIQGAKCAQTALAILQGFLIALVAFPTETVLFNNNNKNKNKHDMRERWKKFESIWDHFDERPQRSS